MSESESSEGNFIRFWQVSPGREERGFWLEFKNANIIAMGWDALGDLNKYSTENDIEKALRKHYPADYPKDMYPTNDVNSVKIFSQLITEGDVIVAKKGASKEVYGIGKVLHGYHFVEARERFKHVIDVEWLIGFDDRIQVETSRDFIQRTAHSLEPTRFDEIRESILKTHPELRPKFQSLLQPPARHFWMEKTYVQGRGAEQHPLYGFSKSLWSPLTTIDGKDTYRNMKRVKAGDAIIHLAKEKRQSSERYTLRGVSIVSKEAEIFGMPPNTEWGDKWRARKLDPKGYVIYLQGYTELTTHLDITEFLGHSKYHDRLVELQESESDLFYNKLLLPNQGKYLTKAPSGLVALLDDFCLEKTGNHLPFMVSARVPITHAIGIIKELIDEEPEYSQMIKFALAHLVAGKNLVFYGAPATSKTYLARRICNTVCGEDNFCFHTANAEWSYFDIVGGLILQGNQTNFKEGILLEATEKCKNSVLTGKGPCWLIIDELNRANLDLAFGKIFTQLDLDYRDRPLETVDKNGESYNYFMPLSFRILATMNTYDRALLFSLGYAFMRRFAFIPLESLLKEGQNMETETRMQITEDVKRIWDKQNIDMLKEKTRRAVFNHFSNTNGTDKAFIYPELEIEDINAIKELIGDLKIEDLSILDVLLYIADKMTNEGMVEIGHAIVFDAVKFVVAYHLLFPGESDPELLLDEVVVSYLLPQLEYFMPKLRKGRIFEEEKYGRSWERLVQTIRNLNLPKTSRKLEEAEEEFKVIH